MSSFAQQILSHRISRLVVLLLAIAGCAWTIYMAANFGFSRLVVRYALATRNLTASQGAVQLTPNDPQAHRANAALSIYYDSPGNAVISLEHALALRPIDYAVWIALGQARDRLGDNQGALAAFNEGVRRAPFYSQAKWQRGNFLLRNGQNEMAFADLNAAAQSNPELLPNIIDLAWNLSRGDAKLTQDVAQITTPKGHLAFAKLLVARGKTTEATEQFKAAGSAAESYRREMVIQLLAKFAFKEAYDVWAGAGESKLGKVAPGAFYDGGFEAPLTTDESGFAWKVAVGSKVVTFSLDPNSPHDGSRSLRLDFAGESNPSSELVSQLLLVEPSKRYQVSFAMRPQNIVTGGQPIVVALDAGPEHKRLGQSIPIKGSGEWTVSNFEFTTLPGSSAVVIVVQREACPSAPCPIFGTLFIDSFSIKQLP